MSLSSEHAGLNERGYKTLAGAHASAPDELGNAPDSEEAVRGLKASESVAAAFHAEGLPSPSGALAAIFTVHVRSATKDIPIHQLRHMTPGAGALGASAAAGVGMYLASLTPQQREIAKSGGNPLDPAAMLKLAGMLNQANGGTMGGGGVGQRGNAGQSPGSGARYDGVPGGTDWTSAKGMAATRNYALNNGMAWATKEPDLMRMGQPAIKALHDAHLQGDGYGILHKPEHMHFDNPTIVSGAEFMKRHNLNYNEAAKAAGAVYHDDEMTPEERRNWQQAVGGVLRSKPGASDADARGNLHDTGEALKKAHPHMAPKVDRALERFNAAKGQANRADASADQKGAAAANLGKAVANKSGKLTDNTDFLNGSDPAPSQASSEKPKGIIPTGKSASAENRRPENKKLVSAATKIAAPSVA